MDTLYCQRENKDLGNVVPRSNMLNKTASESCMAFLYSFREKKMKFVPQLQRLLKSHKDNNERHVGM